MDWLIRLATRDDAFAIRNIHISLNRPARPVRASEYLVAVEGDSLIGCSAVRLFEGGGYLYGLAVRRECQRKGVGSALTQARIDLLTRNRRRLAVVLAMFWNVKFFRRLGFQSVRRDLLPARVRALADFRNPLYKHSAILWQEVP